MGVISLRGRGCPVLLCAENFWLGAPPVSHEGFLGNKKAPFGALRFLAESLIG